MNAFDIFSKYTSMLKKKCIDLCVEKKGIKTDNYLQTQFTS